MTKNQAKYLVIAIASAIIFLSGVNILTYSEIIKAIRKQLNITQEQLAHELNISFSTINRWENGRTIPSRLARVQLLDFCKKRNLSKLASQIVERLSQGGE